MSNTVNITIATFDKTRKADVTLDRTYTVADLIKASQEKWALPTDTEYHVINETRSLQLGPKSTLSTELVANGDQLVIQPLLVAGSLPERLRSDQVKLQALSSSSGGRLQIRRAVGSPAHRYELTLSVRSVQKLDSRGQPVFSDKQHVNIVLPSGYPLPGSPPQVSLEQPLFHPHVFTSGRVCIGNKQMVGEFLDEFVKRLFSIFRFDPDYVDQKSPANPAALAWYNQNTRSGIFPTDQALVPAKTSPKKTFQWTDH